MAQLNLTTVHYIIFHLSYKLSFYRGVGSNIGGGLSHDNNHSINDDDDNTYDIKAGDISCDKHYDPYGDEWDTNSGDDGD